MYEMGDKMGWNILIWVIFFASYSTIWSQSNFRPEAIRLTLEGDLQMKIGNLEQALVCYSNAIEIDRNYPDAYMKRALVFKVVGSYFC